MQNDIGNISKWFDTTVTGDNNDGPERLHVMFIKQKDAEIAQLKLFVENLEKENEELKNEKSNLSGQIEKDNDVINALQKGTEANYKLQTNSVADLAASLKINLEMAEKIGKLEDERNGWMNCITNIFGVSKSN